MIPILAIRLNIGHLPLLFRVLLPVVRSVVLRMGNLSSIIVVARVDSTLRDTSTIRALEAYLFRAVLGEGVSCRVMSCPTLLLYFVTTSVLSLNLQLCLLVNLTSTTYVFLLEGIVRVVLGRVLMPIVILLSDVALVLRMEREAVVILISNRVRLVQALFILGVNLHVN
jgi:hypothetical protein